MNAATIKGALAASPPRFNPGRIVMTPGAIEAMANSNAHDMNAIHTSEIKQNAPTIARPISKPTNNSDIANGGWHELISLLQRSLVVTVVKLDWTCLVRRWRRSEA